MAKSILLAPSLSFLPVDVAPDDSISEHYSHVLTAGDLQPTSESLDLAEQLQEMGLLAPPPDDSCRILVLSPAALLAVALLIVYERSSALSALTALSSHGVALDSFAEPDVAALLRLELRETGSVSDLTSLEGAPRTWTWLRWRTSPASLAVSSHGHMLTARRLRPEPRMAYITEFLTAKECAHIIQLGKNGGALHPSRVVNHASDGDTGVRSDARTSESCRVSAGQDRVVMRAVQRAAYLAGLSPGHSEAVQVVHYEPGQQYRPHYDYFQPTDGRYAAKTAVQGNRLVSIFVYLSDCAGGGRTYFPTLRHGFAPKVGCAAMWYNIDRHGNLDERTLHAGEPVASGEKWGCAPRPSSNLPELESAARILSSNANGAHDHHHHHHHHHNHHHHYHHHHTLAALAACGGVSCGRSAPCLRRSWLDSRVRSA